MPDKPHNRVPGPHEALVRGMTPPTHREPMEHELKTWPEPWGATQRGAKTFEFRRDDGRHFRVGDSLLLREWEPVLKLPPTDEGQYTGRSVVCIVTHLERWPAFGIPEGYVVMSLDRATRGTVTSKLGRRVTSMTIAGKTYPVKHGATLEFGGRVRSPAECVDCHKNIEPMEAYTTASGVAPLCQGCFDARDHAG